MTMTIGVGGATSVSRTTEPPELVMERVYDAPRELVWEVDLRAGGVWHYCMRGTEGEEAWGRAVYREIVEPQRLVLTDAFADAGGNVVKGMPEMLMAVTFEEHEGKTRLTHRTRFASVADLEATTGMGAIAGATESQDRLEAALAGMTR